MGNLIDLTKKAGVVLEKKNLTGVQAQVVFVVDESYSMDGLYDRGVVQETLDRMLGIAMNMDVDKSIEVYGFDNGARYAGSATAGNHSDFVKKAGLKGRGGTNYAPAMELVVKKHGGKKGVLGGLFGKKAPTIPTFVIFMTDGNNSDKAKAEQIIRESANLPIFWQFVGIGYESFQFLQKLDDLKGRYVDNADFFKIDNIAKERDEDLYDKLLNEFPGWLKEVKAKGMI